MSYPLGKNSRPGTPSLHCTEILSLIITDPATCIVSVYLLKQATTSSTMPQGGFRWTCLLYDDT
jgi:hypothetical protein